MGDTGRGAAKIFRRVRLCLPAPFLSNFARRWEGPHESRTRRTYVQEGTYLLCLFPYLQIVVTSQSSGFQPDNRPTGRQADRAGSSQGVMHIKIQGPIALRPGHPGTASGGPSLPATSSDVCAPHLGRAGQNGPERVERQLDTHIDTHTDRAEGVARDPLPPPNHKRPTRAFWTHTEDPNEKKSAPARIGDKQSDRG